MQMRGSFSLGVAKHLRITILLLKPSEAEGKVVMEGEEKGRNEIGEERETGAACEEL